MLYLFFSIFFYPHSASFFNLLATLITKLINDLSHSQVWLDTIFFNQNSSDLLWTTEKKKKQIELEQGI